MRGKLSDPMTEDSSTEAPALEPMPEADRNTRATPPSPAANRRLAVRFVAGFLVSVFLLLMGYRAAVNAGGDRWYLQQVARSTSWVLARTGHSSRLDLSHKDGPRVMFVAWAAPNLLLREAQMRLADARST